MESKKNRSELTQIRWTPEERALIDKAVAVRASREERTISGLIRSSALARAREVIAEAKRIRVEREREVKAKARRRRLARTRARIHVGKEGGRK